MGMKACSAAGTSTEELKAMMLYYVNIDPRGNRFFPTLDEAKTAARNYAKDNNGNPVSVERVVIGHDRAAVCSIGNGTFGKGEVVYTTKLRESGA